MIGKKELIKKVQTIGNFKSFKEAEKALESVCSAYVEALKETDGAKIYGVGILHKKVKKARKIKVPKIKEKVVIPDRNGVFFKEDKDFAKELN